jgi:DNA-binding Lrp family transcriptional regulator
MSNFDSENIKKKIILELKKESPLWINEIHRRLIIDNNTISIPTVSKIIDELEKEGLVTSDTLGTAKTVRLKNEIN